MENQTKLLKALQSANRQFCKLYKQLSGFVNVSYDSLCIYIKFVFVTDCNQQMLVRSKILSIFKPSVKCLLSTVASGTHLGLLGGVQTAVKQLEEHNKVNQLSNSSLLQTCKSWKGKKISGRKDAKKVAARGSKGTGKKNPK